MRARIDEADMEVHQVMEVNFFGQVALTRAVLPYAGPGIWADGGHQ